MLLLTTVLRIPSLYEPYWYGDEGIYLVLGKALRQGLVWYRDIHDNKPPMLYLLAALSGNVMWFRFLTLIANLVNVWVIWRLAQNFFRKQTMVVAATTLFVLASSLPALEGNIANAEIFMILPTSAAMLLLLKAKKSQAYFWAGILFAVSFLFKVPSLFDFAAAFFWLLFFGGLSLKWKSGWWMKLILLSTGFALPIAATFVYYWWVGAGQEYLVAAYLQNLGYLSSWRTGEISRSGASSQSGLLSRGLVLLLGLAIVWLMTRKETMEKRLLPVWFSFALFGALLSERPYPHYLIQIVPPAVLLLPQLFTASRKYYSAVILGLAGVTIGAVLRFNFYFYSNTDYYLNFARYITRQSTVEEYRNSFDWRVQRNYDIAKYIKLRSQPSERIFIWGDEPFIYALADRLPVGRYTVAYHIVDFGGRDETFSQIKSQPPRFIVLEESETRKFDELIAFTLANYVAVAEFEDATIYLHLDGE